MHTATRIVATATLALVLHLTLGWAWTLAAGLAGGAWARRRGWLVGTLGVTLGWAVLVAYNFVVAGAAVQTMTSTVGGLLGNMPGVAVVAATVFIGGLLGLLGGVLGGTLRRIAT